MSQSHSSSAPTVRKMRSTVNVALAVAFRVYDTDGDGYVSEAELEAGMRHMVGGSMTDEQLAATAAHTLAEHDTDGDGRLSLKEFRDMVSAATGDGPTVAVAAH